MSSNCPNLQLCHGQLRLVLSAGKEMQRLEHTSELTKILANQAITPYFQPIFDLNSGELYGHEALTRGPKNSSLHSPLQLFTLAEEHKKLHQLEIMCREKAIIKFAELALPGKLFLNVSASLLGSPEHQKGMTLAILDRLNIAQHNIVMELSEQHKFEHDGLSHATIEHYRKMGFKVAIDDLGVGYSGLQLWSEIQPEIVKIDKHFIQNIDQDAVKKEFVRAMVAIGNRLGCDIIAEGIETSDELEQLIKLGVKKGQGYLLGRPTPIPTENESNILNVILSRRRFQKHVRDSVMSLSKFSPTLNVGDELKTASLVFRQAPEVMAIPILQNNKPIGVIRRSQLHELFSTPYGRALYENTDVSQMLTEDALIVESHISLSTVSMQLTNQDATSLNNEIIITQQGEYLGMGSLKDLLKRITELKIQNATYSNPLTLLPGNVPLNQEIDERMHAKQGFYIAYFDLNHFKPFNDVCGYAKGDEVIKLVGALIEKHINQAGHFISHIGGDDFVVVFSDDSWQKSCQKILTEFEAEVKQHYDNEQLEAGGVYALDRHGEMSFHSLLSLAIGVVQLEPNQCENHLQVAEIAAKAKKVAKKQGGNICLLYDLTKGRPSDTSLCC
ncbi:Signaling protein (EAL,CBS,GGDEF domains) [Marinomonas sp. MED121]|nr:Signaling protein (EAL,CBS,GGDEF domains) [Marinomonas sp. MED121]